VDTLPDAGQRVLPLQATVKDWCTVAVMLYPAADPVAISWDNVEVVAVLADKYDIPSLLQRAATFLENSVRDMCPAHGSGHRRIGYAPTCSSCGCGLDSKGRCTNCRKSDPGAGNRDIWKWLQLSDRFNMARLTVACIELIVRNYRDAATPQKLVGLSSATKDLLLAELLSPGQAAHWKNKLPADIKKQRLSVLVSDVCVVGA
jgi:hypothetical protein